MVKKIPLGGKRGKGKFALVDDGDYEILSKYSWYLNAQSYAAGSLKAKNELGDIRMHRVVNRTPSNMHTDHIDHDPLNNRRSNLRTVTPSQNMMNTRKRKTTSSRYKGVAWDESIKRWISSITVGGTSYYLGSFPTQKKAAKRYNAEAKKRFGEYACLNEIIDDANDKPVIKRHRPKPGIVSYRGVGVNKAKYSASFRGKHLGTFPNKKFAALIYDAAVISELGGDALKYVNFPEKVNNPLCLNTRYVFQAQNMKNTLHTRYVGVFQGDDRRKWRSTLIMNGKKRIAPFDTEIQAAENYDKMVLMYRDDMVTYLNFPEKLPIYLAEIGGKIVSKKHIQLGF